MSREIHDRLIEAGINPDRVLQSTTTKIMGKFNERFHPADSSGYAYGIQLPLLETGVLREPFVQT